MQKIIINIILLLLTCGNINSQVNSSTSQPNSLPDKENISTSATSSSGLYIGALAFLYLLNPIVLYEDKKFYAGITKELSVGFGKLGQHRFAFEYSFIFSGNISNHIRLSYKYDLLLKDKIEPSNNLQGTSALAIGGGYFTNFDKQGIFPELTFGYSLRNHKLLIFPHIKIRHTFMFKKQDTDNTDISFGIILGIANPFIDVKIRRDN
jgi:hypothetical protein